MPLRSTDICHTILNQVDLNVLTMPTFKKIVLKSQKVILIRQEYFLKWALRQDRNGNIDFIQSTKKCQCKGFFNNLKTSRFWGKLFFVFFM